MTFRALGGHEEKQMYVPEKKFRRALKRIGYKYGSRGCPSIYPFREYLIRYLDSGDAAPQSALTPGARSAAPEAAARVLVRSCVGVIAISGYAHRRAVLQLSRLPRHRSGRRAP